MSIGGTIRLLVSKYHPPLASPFLGPNPVFEINPRGVGLRGKPVPPGGYVARGVLAGHSVHFQMRWSTTIRLEFVPRFPLVIPAVWALLVKSCWFMMTPMR